MSRKGVVVKQEVFDETLFPLVVDEGNTKTNCKMTRDSTFKNDNDLEFGIVNKDTIKSEVMEIKSEPMEVNLKDSEIYFSNPDDGNEAFSSKEKPYSFLNGEMMLQIFEYPNTVGSKSPNRQNLSNISEKSYAESCATKIKTVKVSRMSNELKKLFVAIPISRTKTCLKYNEKVNFVPGHISSQTDNFDNLSIANEIDSPIKVTNQTISNIDSSNENITSLKVSNINRPMADSRLNATNLKVPVVETVNSIIKLSNLSEQKTNSPNSTLKHKNLKMADTTTSTMDTSSCGIKTYIKRKRKLHEISDPLSDEEEEKRRLSAINARKNREIKKSELDQLREKFSEQQALNTNLELNYRNVVNEKKIALLEKENVELRYQILLDKYNRLLELHSNCSAIK